jgi:hypothetical protein
MSISIRGALNILYHNSKKSAKTRKLRGRIDAGQHDIDLTHLEDIWKQQDGRCYYSNIPMQYKKNEWKVSIERLDNTKGYIKGNVVLCCLEFNSRSQWTNNKIENMLDILDHNIECIETEFKIKVKKKYEKVEKKIVDGIKYCKCTWCKEFKEYVCFNKIGEICRKCINKRTKETNSTPRGTIKRLCTAAHNSAKIRSQKQQSDRSIVDIDLIYLIQLYTEQKGLCAYSGIPLKFGSYLKSDWVVSLERIDVTKGYTKDNVCLICLEFNSSDQTMKTGPDYGCAGWNPLKFQYFLAHIHHKKGLISDEELQAVIDIQEQFKEKEKRTSWRRPPRIGEVLDAIKKAKRNYAQAHEFYGHIYCVTSPSGKQFIGQSNLLFHKTHHTVFAHANKFGYTSFIKETDKYGEDKMIIEQIVSCKKDMLDYYQNYFIDLYNTYEPNGLNFKNKVKDEVKSRISKTIIENNVRFDHNNNKLPLYVKYVNWVDRKGYSIVSHPKCKLKYFVSKKKSLEILYEECVSYLDAL